MKVPSFFTANQFFLAGAQTLGFEAYRISNGVFLKVLENFRVIWGGQACTSNTPKSILVG